MATQNELIDPLLNKRQKENQAKQLPQAGLSPAQGIANLASAVPAAAGAAVDSVGRGLAQQGRAIGTVAGGVAGGIADGAEYLNRGDPIRDAAGAVGRGIAAMGNFFTESAAKARTSDYGQMIPGERNGSIPGRLQAVPQAAETPTQSNNTATAPVVPAAVAAPVQQQTAPVQPVSTSTSMSSSLKMPASIGDLAPGTGMIKNSRTGKVTAIGSEQPQQQQQQPVMQITRGAPQMISPAAAAASEQIALHNDLMARPNGGIGEGLVARGAMNKAKTFSGIATDQQQANTAAQNSGIAAFNAQSQDADRRTDNEIKRDAQDEKKRSNALRDELASMDDKNDPGGVKRASLRERLAILSGNDKGKFTPIYSTDPMTGEKTAVGSFDAHTGYHYNRSGQRVSESFSQAPEDAKARAIGQTYQTPKGPLVWRGNGWEAVAK